MKNEMKFNKIQLIRFKLHPRYGQGKIIYINAEEIATITQNFKNKNETCLHLSTGNRSIVVLHTVKDVILTIRKQGVNI